MNHAFKLIWSRQLGMLIPVAEVMRKVGRVGRILTARAQRRRAKRALERAGIFLLNPKPLTTQIAAMVPVASLAVLLAPSLAFAQTPPAAQALPQGGQVVAGAAAVSQNGANLTVTQTTPQIVINWQSFNVGANASVNFRTPKAVRA